MFPHTICLRSLLSLLIMTQTPHLNALSHGNCWTASSIVLTAIGTILCILEERWYHRKPRQQGAIYKGFVWDLYEYKNKDANFGRITRNKLKLTDLKSCVFVSLCLCEISADFDEFSTSPSLRAETVLANRWLFSSSFLICLTQNASKQFRVIDKYKWKNLPQNQWRHSLQNVRNGAWSSSNNENFHSGSTVCNPDYPACTGFAKGLYWIK